MSNSSSSSSSGSASGGGAGRTALWIALALTVLLLGWVTATAVRANPIYSDRDAYGVSKYHFIELCREKLHAPNDLPLMLGPGQTQPLLTAVKGTGEMRGDDTLQVVSTATPAQTDQAVQTTGNGPLQMTLPVLIQFRSTGGATRPLVPVNMQCSYDKSKPANERLQVMLVPGG